MSKPRYTKREKCSNCGEYYNIRTKYDVWHWGFNPCKACGASKPTFGGVPLVDEVGHWQPRPGFINWLLRRKQWVPKESEGQR